MVASASFSFFTGTICLLFFTFQWWTCLVSGVRDSYIVHMDVSSMPRVFSSHHHWYNSLLTSDHLVNAADDASAASPSLIYTYTEAIHGFSAVLSSSQLGLLKQTPGFVASHPDQKGTMHTTHTYKYLGLNTITGIWPSSKYGKDIIIGVLDTGVWPESPSFRDDGLTEVPKKWKGRCETGTAFNASMCNKKLIGARFFNKGVLAEDPNRTISMNSARDTDGHGTHTASIAAGSYVAGASYFGYAQGTARGVAPRARVAVYKVIWPEGMFASDVIAAMDQAIADGVDVLSLSLSYNARNFYEDPVFIASFAAMEKGILVSAAAGNRNDPDFGSVENGAPWMLSVGATNIDRRFSGIASLGNGASFVGVSLYIGSKSVENLPLYYNQSDAACKSVNSLKNKVNGKVVVCEYDGEDRSVSQTSIVADAKAAGALLLNSDSNQFVRAKDYDCPAVVLSASDSAALKDYIRASNRPTVSLTFRKTITGVKPAPTLALFSTRGPASGTPTILKPDIVAPGVLILAAYSPNSDAATLRGKSYFSNFTLLSGTSMSCPHASGLAALLKSAHPDWSVSAIRSAMMTTANTVNNQGKSIYQGISPLSMGAGEINPNKAMDPGLVYDAGHQDYVKFLCALNLTREQFQTIVKNSSHYDQCNDGGNLDLNYPAFVMISKFGQSSGAQSFKRVVTNVGADGPVTYTAKYMKTERSGSMRVSVVPPKLVFERRNQKASFSLTVEVIKPMASLPGWGFLNWVDDQEKHIVTSPIVVSME